MDLLEKLWVELDPAGRDRLSSAIVAGPPDSLLDHLPENERLRSRDRRVFDRLIILERLADPPLSDSLKEKLESLRGAYPEWVAQEGERAHFGSWMEMRWGAETNYTVDDFVSLDDGAIATALRDETERREGLTDTWHQFAKAYPERAFEILEALQAYPGGKLTDVWEAGLRGVRESTSGLVHSRLIELLLQAPEALLDQREVAFSIVDLLETVSRAEVITDMASFWALFDRIASSGAQFRESVGAENGKDWFIDALNSVLGKLATAFLNMLFKRGLRVGDGLPNDLIERLNFLVSPDREAHRPARVIAASRLSYLFAVDRDWTHTNLLSGFHWNDEEESIAMWQGYSWNLRIDPLLWKELSESFFALFRPDRLDRMARRRNLGQLIMLVGIEFGGEETSREDARNAIRSMTDEMRIDAMSWVEGYLNQSKLEKGEKAQVGSTDELWRRRVAPWIRKVWPPDLDLRSPAVSEELAQAAITTDEEFPNAVETIRPYLVRANGFYVLARLNESPHPDRHPRPTIALVDALVERTAPRLSDTNLVNILARIRAADSAMEEDATFRRWSDWLGKAQR